MNEESKFQTNMETSNGIYHIKREKNKKDLNYNDYKRQFKLIVLNNLEQKVQLGYHY